MSGHSFDVCTIDLYSGWIAFNHGPSDEEQYDFCRITPPTNDAELRLTSCLNMLEQGMDPSDWIERCSIINRSLGRDVREVRFGDFAGIYTEFSSSTFRIRGFELQAGKWAIDVCYRGDVNNADRDDPAVDEMLATLRLNV